MEIASLVKYMNRWAVEEPAGRGNNTELVKGV